MSAWLSYGAHLFGPNTNLNVAVKYFLDVMKIYNQ